MRQSLLTMKRETTILDRIGSLIPGYAGYAKRDNQRKADKALRSYISLKLKEVEDGMQELMRKTMRGNPHLLGQAQWQLNSKS